MLLLMFVLVAGGCEQTKNTQMAAKNQLLELTLEQKEAQKKIAEEQAAVIHGYRKKEFDRIQTTHGAVRRD